MPQITGRLRTPRLDLAPANPMPGEVFFHRGKDVLCVYRARSGWSDVPTLAAPPEGPQGEPGAQGPPGADVPGGGVAGQVLVKLSDSDFDFAWADATAIAQPGPRGDYLWQGSGPPNDDMPGARPGDDYLDTDTGDVYELS